MNIPQRDMIAGAVLILYIVFFGMSPPSFVKDTLSNPIGAAAAFGLAIYVTLYQSKPVGALLIVALLTGLSRSGSREGFDVYTGTFDETGYLNRNPDVKTNVQSGKGFASGRAHWDAAGKREGRQGSGLTKATLTEGKSYKCSEGGPAFYLFKDGKLNAYPNGAVATSWDSAWASGPAIPCASVPKGPTMAMKPGAAAATPPATTPPVSTPPAATPPAAAAPAAAKPKPVMACNIENFAAF
jgi:hypothetical protein